MWVELYRPRDIEDVVSQQEVLKILLGALDHGQLPHLLLYGPPGTGKTSTILAIARKLYHPSVWSDRVLEMNASDERGIKVVRSKIKTFAQQSVSITKHDGYPSPPFKIVILDEADTMTVEAQGALRRLMEMFASVTRFCLVCNYVSRVIEPLVSRCSKLRFTPLDSTSMRDRLRAISSMQKVAYDEAVYDKILKHSNGDMRRAVTLLQSCVSFYGSKMTVITDASLEKISSEVPSTFVNMLFAAARLKDFVAMSEAIDGITLEGFSAASCLSSIHDAVLNDTSGTDQMKAALCEAIAKADKNLADGANGRLQLYSTCAALL